MMTIVSMVLLKMEKSFSRHDCTRSRRGMLRVDEPGCISAVAE